jgi:hypothetical protein
MAPTALSALSTPPGLPGLPPISDQLLGWVLAEAFTLGREINLWKCCQWKPCTSLMCGLKNWVENSSKITGSKSTRVDLTRWA